MPGTIRGAGGHRNSVALALDQGPTGPWGRQSLGFLEGNLEMAALARRAVPARALSSGSRPADPTGGSGWHSSRVNSPWSSHAANPPLIRFMCLFFFAIGCGNANSAASSCFQKAPGVLGSGWAAPTRPHTPGFQDADPPIRRYQSRTGHRGWQRTRCFLEHASGDCGSRQC